VEIAEGVLLVEMALLIPGSMLRLRYTTDLLGFRIVPMFVALFDSNIGKHAIE
jgi:hypothetical protein